MQALLAAVSLFGNEFNSGVSVLGRGTFHGDEVTAESGEAWMALLQKGLGFELVQVELLVLPQRDQILDRDGEISGKRACCLEGKALLFLRSEEDVFISGEVEPLIYDTDLIYEGDSFVLGSGESINADVTGLYFTRNDETLRICDVYENLYGEGVSIFWAGDLDGDGLNDLIVNDCGHYNIFTNYRVFLSSFAEPGEPLGEVASFMATGC